MQKIPTQYAKITTTVLRIHNSSACRFASILYGGQILLAYILCFIRSFTIANGVNRYDKQGYIKNDVLPVGLKLGDTSISANVKNIKPTLMHKHAMKSSLEYCLPEKQSTSSIKVFQLGNIC